MKSRYEIKVFNAGAFLILYIFLGLYSWSDVHGMQRAWEAGAPMHTFIARATGNDLTRISLGSFETAISARVYHDDVELLANSASRKFARLNKK